MMQVTVCDRNAVTVFTTANAAKIDTVAPALGNFHITYMNICTADDFDAMPRLAAAAFVRVAFTDQLSAGNVYVFAVGSINHAINPTVCTNRIEFGIRRHDQRLTVS